MVYEKSLIFVIIRHLTVIYSSLFINKFITLVKKVLKPRNEKNIDIYELESRICNFINSNYF